MQDDFMMMPKRIQTKSNSWETPGALQSTPLTRDRAPAIQAETTKERGNYRVFILHVDLLDTTNKKCRSIFNLSTPLTRSVAYIEDVLQNSNLIGISKSSSTHVGSYNFEDW